MENFDGQFLDIDQKILIDYGNVFHDFYLYHMQDVKINKNYWRLDDGGDPFTWNVKPEAKPSLEINSLLIALEKNNPMESWLDKVKEFEKSLLCDPKNGFRLVNGAIQDGFNFKESFPSWLFNKLGKHIRHEIMR